MQAPAFAAAVTLLLAACGSGASDDEQIRGVLETFLAGYNENSAQDAYGVLDSKTQAACSLDDFQEFYGFAKVIIGDQELRLSAFEDVRVDGDRATALVGTLVGDIPSDEPPELTEFVREGGEWRLVLEDGDCKVQ